MIPAALADLVGQEVGLSRWFTMDQARIDAFAEATEDFQFIHTDPEKAAQTPFGTTIAHGYLTLSMLAAMSYDVLPALEGEVMGVNYGANRVRFLAPVPAGSRIRGRFVLDDVKEHAPGEITATHTVTVEIEGAEKPALIAEIIGRRYVRQDTDK